MSMENGVYNKDEIPTKGISEIDNNKNEKETVEENSKEILGTPKMVINGEDKKQREKIEKEIEEINKELRLIGQSPNIYGEDTLNIKKNLLNAKKQLLNKKGEKTGDQTIIGYKTGNKTEKGSGKKEEGLNQIGENIKNAINELTGRGKPEAIQGFKIFVNGFILKIENLYRNKEITTSEDRENKIKEIKNDYEKKIKNGRSGLSTKIVGTQKIKDLLNDIIVEIEKKYQLDEKKEGIKGDDKIRKMKIGKWEMKIGTSEIIDSLIVEKLENFLNKKWIKVMREMGDNIENSWWSIKKLGIPSPIIRIDMSPDGIYEVEVRPGGIGLFLSLVPEKIKQWKEILKSCGCQGIINFKSSIRDDKIAARLLDFPYYGNEEKILDELKKGESPYWMRTNSRSGDLNRFEGQSLVPIQLDGDKRYLVKLGLAEILTTEEQINWSEPFVIKPLVGARTEDVKIYIPESLVGQFGYRSSLKSEILQVISTSQKEKALYIKQKFIPPQKEEINGNMGQKIWRLYFGWQEDQKDQGGYDFIGGLWNWRPYDRGLDNINIANPVHGASDAVFGAIKQEDIN